MGEHGALQAGALTTSFTASQGLLLMIPNLYKIAGELTPFVLHVAARTVATHALSIFGDHSNVMAVRQTGVALLASNIVQEAHDLALIAQMATLSSRIPFVHFFDGFRTSHEIAKVSLLADATLRELLDEEQIEQHRRRALTPDRPVLRGTAQNPDVFFQAREACNPYYQACPQLVQEAMDRFAAVTGRAYHLFDYTGDPEAKRVLVEIPIAVKLAPFYSSLLHLGDALTAEGADGLIIFNRFYEAELDVEELTVERRLALSSSAELPLRLRWLAILSGKIDTSLAVTGGVHTRDDAIKALMCGADAVQLVSVLLAEGIDALPALRRGLSDWLEEHEYHSLDQLRGSMNIARCPDPSIYQRANYIHLLHSFRV